MPAATSSPSSVSPGMPTPMRWPPAGGPPPGAPIPTAVETPRRSASADHARWVLTDERRRASYVQARGDRLRQAAARSADDARSARADDFYRGGWVDGDDADYFDTAPPDGWSTSAGDGDADERSPGDGGAAHTASAGRRDRDGWDDDRDDWDDDDDPFGIGTHRARRTGRTGGSYPRRRHRCARCFRHALLGGDRCWACGTADELAAAIRLAGPGRCPVLNQRNMPCRATPTRYTAPFCIHHALGYQAPGHGSGSPPPTSGPGAAEPGAATGARHGPGPARGAGASTWTRDQTDRGRPRSGRSASVGGAPAATAGSSATTNGSMLGCLLALVVVFLAAGFLEQLAQHASLGAVLFYGIVGWIVVRRVARGSARRRRSWSAGRRGASLVRPRRARTTRRRGSGGRRRRGRHSPSRR